MMLSHKALVLGTQHRACQFAMFDPNQEIRAFQRHGAGNRSEKDNPQHCGKVDSDNREEIFPILGIEDGPPGAYGVLAGR
jgi:hypothetical protein